MNSGIVAILKAIGSSMNPIILENDILFVNEYKSIQKDMIIAFHDNNQIISHRVVEIMGQKVKTKGDNSKNCDRIVDMSEIIGVIKKGLRINDKNVTVLNLNSKKFRIKFYSNNLFSKL